jgi:hypothetical protein
MDDVKPTFTVEAGDPVSEEDRRIEGYHKMLHSLFKSEDDIITAQAVSSFMGCVMAHSEEWKRIIPGFMKEMIDYANYAMAAHRHAETLTNPKEQPDGECETLSEAGEAPQKQN